MANHQGSIACVCSHMKKLQKLCLILGLIIVAGSVAQADEGKFKPLFNGKNLNGWEPTPGGNWEVKGGVIVGTSPKSEPAMEFYLPRSDSRILWLKLSFVFCMATAGSTFESIA